MLHLNYLLILISRCNINLKSNINTVEGEQITYKKAFPPHETPLGEKHIKCVIGFVSFKNNVFSLEPMCIKLGHTKLIYFIVCAFFLINATPIGIANELQMLCILSQMVSFIY